MSSRSCPLIDARQLHENRSHAQASASITQDALSTNCEPSRAAFQYTVGTESVGRELSRDATQPAAFFCKTEHAVTAY